MAKLQRKFYISVTNGANKWFFIKVIGKVKRLGGENGQFRHNIGHRKLNSKWNFTKRKIWRPKLVFSTKFGGKLSFIPSFLFPERPTIAAYIFTAPTCTTTIITLIYCALNAKFKHFVLRFNRISLLCRYHWKRG